MEDAKSQPGIDFPSLWLATQDYLEAPQKETAKQEMKANEGTPLPIPGSFNWPFVGQTVEDVAEWLKQKPASVDLDAHHFAILDRKSGKDRSIVVCKIGDIDLKGDRLNYHRYPAQRASTLLMGIEYGEWEETSPEESSTIIQYDSSS